MLHENRMDRIGTKMCERKGEGVKVCALDNKAGKLVETWDVFIKGVLVANFDDKSAAKEFYRIRSK